MRADELLAMKVDDLERALAGVDDEGLLRFLLSSEKRKTARDAIERRLAQTASGHVAPDQPLPAEGKPPAAEEPAPPPSASGTGLAPLAPPSPPSPPPSAGPAQVRLRLARALSFRSGGLRAKEGDIVEVPASEARRLLEAGIWEEVP